MISFLEALSYIKQQTQCIAQSEEILLENALGKISSSIVLSPISMPPLANSAMDGYAVNSSTLKVNKPYEVLIECAAGQKRKKIQTHEVARIFTGALIPENADSIVPQELITISNGKVFFSKEVLKNQHIRHRGEDFHQDDSLLEKGDYIDARVIALLANAGIATVAVFKPINITLLATGDELIPAGEPWEEGKLYDSNRPAIASILRGWGFNINHTCVIKDDFELTKQVVKDASKKSDIIISTGGVSVGEKDYIRAVLEELGKLNVWKVKMKPGKPLALGKVNGVNYIGLPGNPVSAFCVLLLLGRPLLKQFQGANEKHAFCKPIRVKCDFDYRSGFRQDFLRAKYVSCESYYESKVELFNSQNSHITSSLQWADGLLSVPEQLDVKQGDELDFFPFSQLL